MQSPDEIHEGLLAEQPQHRILQCYTLSLVSSFGQTQYIPPGMSWNLTTLVATIDVPQDGQGFCCRIPLSPMLARAVFEIFSAIFDSFPFQKTPKSLESYSLEPLCQPHKTI